MPLDDNSVAWSKRIMSISHTVQPSQWFLIKIDLPFEWQISLPE